MTTRYVHYRLFECDFQNNTASDAKTENGVLQVVSRNIGGAEDYLMIDFADNIFQDNSTDYLFTPLQIDTSGTTKDYAFDIVTYTGSLASAPKLVNPKFIGFSSDDTAYYSAFTSSIWSVLGWTPPDSDYNGWIDNLAQSWANGETNPNQLNVNLYVFKVINLPFTGAFSSNTRWLPVLYYGNDANADSIIEVA